MKIVNSHLPEKMKLYDKDASNIVGMMIKQDAINSLPTFEK